MSAYTKNSVKDQEQISLGNILLFFSQFEKKINKMIIIIIKKLEISVPKDRNSAISSEPFSFLV